MSTTTLRHSTGADRAPRFVSPSDERDPRTDEELRKALRALQRSGSWETADAQALLAEVRGRAVRNAAHVAAAAGVEMERGLVDDVLLAAWLVLRRNGDKVLAAARPWAYLMSSAQRQVLDEVRAQQLLTSTASIRGRARAVLPSVVRPVGSTATDLAAALRHERSDADTGAARRIVRQVRQHEQPPLVHGSRTHRSATSASHGSSRSSTCSSCTALTRQSPWPPWTGWPTCSSPRTSAGGNGPLAATRSSRN